MSAVTQGLDARGARNRVRTPEAVLDALDPEQREVATALSGPVVVLAGAGTGKTRAITHRIAYAVLTGQHDPRRTLAVTFTSRAAGEMRQRLAELGVEGVSARTFHSAALRQLRYFWPRVVGGQVPEILPSKARVRRAGAASRGVHRHLARARRRRRDRVGEVQPDRRLRLRRRGARRASRTAGEPHPRERRGAVRGVRRREDRAGAHRLRGRPAPHGRHPRHAARRRGRGALGLPLVHRRRVPGRQPAAAAAARPLGRRARRPVRGRRREPDDLHVHRRELVLPRRLPQPLPPRHGGQARPVLPLDPAGRGARKPRARELDRPGGAAAPRAARHPSRRPRAPGAHLRRRAGRGRVGREADLDPHRGRHPGARDRGALPHQRAVRGRSRRRSARPGSPTSCVASRRSSSAARCARP